MPAARPRICTRCVMPESPPHVTLDANGVCNLCRDHRPPEGPPRLETDFTRLLKRHRGKGEHDCLVMCSGGKDSTAALYYMVRRYKLRPLAFTFDHGFETPEALANVKRAVELLDVDWMTFRSTFMQDMFARILSSGSGAVICHVCSIWYMQLTYKMAARFDIPLIIAGWTQGQATQGPVGKGGLGDETPEFTKMTRATLDFLDTLRDDPRYKDFPRSMNEVVKRARRRHKSVVLSPHWFLPYDADHYVDTIERELDWKAPSHSYPGRSTNCSLNFVSVDHAMRHHGYTHYHVEMSKQIRLGELTRDEALDLLRIEFGPDEVEEIAAPLRARAR